MSNLRSIKKSARWETPTMKQSNHVAAHLAHTAARALRFILGGLCQRIALARPHRTTCAPVHATAPPMLSSCHRMPLCVPWHSPHARAIPPCELTVGRVAHSGTGCSRPKLHFYARPSPRDHAGPKTK
ncbi:hypothetical protein PIB30_063495 [Stylosanthes scabra]|uniref:Uncharacterized protein n=1 Tax=Stylosanthes scabra TaxID=79078 RepID=A0ABU6QM51_9FABA|nr:hypothetical protein [Stylosanthes scabra]